MSNLGTSHVISKETVQETRWLRFVKVVYADEPNGRERLWDAVERVTTPEGGVDAVVAIAIIKKTNEESKLLVVKQVRQHSYALHPATICM